GGAIDREQLASHLRAMGALLRDIEVVGTGADAALLSNPDLKPELTHLAGSYRGERASAAYAAVDRALAALDRNAGVKAVEHREQEAGRIAMLKIRERGLGMKLARVEQAFDGSKLIFYFTADGRVDFRELVRELASEFRTRIEMRQIGVRDEAKMLGGYGTC